MLGSGWEGMTMSVRRTHGWAVLIAAVSVIFAAGTVEAVGVAASLVPSAASVGAGTEFEVRLHVENLGIEFNTYEAAIGYDPARLTFIEAVPLSAQEGPYMTSACGNTYHLFDAQPSALHITHSLLCLNQYLATSGDVYILRFRANSVGGPTQIRFDAIAFYRAGFSVNLASATNATVQITGGTTDSPVPGARQPRLAVAPNPFNPTTVVTIESPVAGFQRVLVHDAAGHLVTTLESGEFAAGTRRVVWHGTSANGVRLASGAYVVSVHSAAGVQSQRVVLLK
jgi:hypothetical protein